MAAVSGVGVTVVDRPGAVREVVLDRPGALNALSTAMAAALADAFAGAAADPAVRVVALSSAVPRAFSVGADLKERDGLSDAELLAQRRVFRTLFDALFDLPQPVVAAVHGFALGSGTELALAADLVVADPSAVFGLPEVSVGLVPGGGGTQTLPRRLGAGRAADLLLTGRRVTFAEAVALGLVDRPVEAGQDVAAALELAATIAGNSPVAVRAAKQALRRGADADLRTALDVEDAAWRTAALSADRREGIAAFVARRRPDWPGV